MLLIAFIKNETVSSSLSAASDLKLADPQGQWLKSCSAAPVYLSHGSLFTNWKSPLSTFNCNIFRVKRMQFVPSNAQLRAVPTAPPDVLKYFLFEPGQCRPNRISKEATTGTMLLCLAGIGRVAARK